MFRSGRPAIADIARVVRGEIKDVQARITALRTETILLEKDLREKRKNMGALGERERYSVERQCREEVEDISGKRKGIDDLRTEVQVLVIAGFKPAHLAIIVSDPFIFLFNLKL